MPEHANCNHSIDIGPASVVLTCATRCLRLVRMEYSRGSIATTTTGLAPRGGPIARIDASDALDREHQPQRTRAFQPPLEQGKPRLGAPKKLRNLAQFELSGRTPSPKPITR